MRMLFCTAEVLGKGGFMKKTSKRSLIVLLSVLAVVIVAVVIVPAVEIITFDYISTWKVSADYKPYANDFNTVKDYIASEYPDESNKWLSVLSKDGKSVIYDPDTKKYLQLPSDVAASLDTICKNAFPDKDSFLDTIRIHKNRISFCISRAPYALVFSPDEKPTWLTYSDKEHKVKVKTIGGGWYHVREIG